MKVKSFKNNSSRAENTSAKKISDENLSHISIEETDLQKNKRKETVKDVKNLAAREGMNLLNSFRKISSGTAYFPVESRNLYFPCLSITTALR